MKKRSAAYWIFLRVPLWLVAASVLVVLLFKWVPVRYTPLMLKRSFQFREAKEYRTQKHWVPLKQISPHLIQAVVSCEDRSFFLHHGFDWPEIRKMVKAHRTEGKPLRGCSTISQQTAKNVFTLGSRTWARKAMEGYWTFLIERLWGKRRIMEVYLNVVETGKGLFGAEAATRYYYGKSARKLNRDQAVNLALCLPSPLERSPLQLGAKEQKRRVGIITGIGVIEYPYWAK